MAYGKIQRDGTVAPASPIVGYRVVYEFNGLTRLMRYRDRAGQLKTQFPNSMLAISAMRRARWGTNPRIVPVYLKAKK